MGEPVFDLDSVYRYLVPDEYKSRLRGAGITGGLSAAVSVCLQSDCTVSYR
jgi:ubiquitin-like-conjugating enzyme ATG10